MESKVIFRDYQEQQAQDHNDLQTFTERTFDHIVYDAVTAERRYAGFTVTKTGQAEVQIQPGRMYDVLGVIYALNTTTTQSMVSYLAAAYKRYVLVTAVGTDVETDIEERDYLIDVTTGATEPRAVATTRSRAAVLTFTNGVETGDPIKPSVPISHVAIAYILVDTTQIVSIEMVESNRVTNTDSLDIRCDALELFDSIIGPRVAALAADLADLRNRINQLGNARLLAAVAQDVARVKASLRYNVTGAVDYQTDWYLDEFYSDSDNTRALGYNALVQEGLRFGYENMDEWELQLFSANDPNADFHNGLLLPKFSEVMRLATSTGSVGYDPANPTATIPSAPPPAMCLGMAQYGYQTTTMKQGYMSRSRLRYGDSFWTCSNGLRWDQNDVTGSILHMGATYFNPVSQLYDNASGVTSTRLTAAGAQIYGPAEPYGLIEGMAYEVTRYDHYWFDEWKEPFLYAVTVDHSVMGAFIAQTFLVPNDIWATSLRIYVCAKGGPEDIHVAICEVTSGMPNPDKTMVKLAYPQSSIVVGWNSIKIPTTFMRKGKKYALVLISNANHSVGMTDGQNYLDGTFFWSTDGIYYTGDLSKDLMMQVWGAQFDNSQVAIEVTAINLDGGFRNVDLLANMWIPNSTKLIFEVQPQGTGEWQPMTPDNAGIFSATPPNFARLRIRFDGTREMHAGIMLTGSRMRAWRPKTVFTHVSEGFTLASACTTIKITCVMEHFDDTPHDHGCTLKTGAAYNVNEVADAQVTKCTDLAAMRWEREYTFNVSPAISQFLIIQTGTTNSAQNIFHVAERTFLGM